MNKASSQENKNHSIQDNSSLSNKEKAAERLRFVMGQRESEHKEAPKSNKACSSVVVYTKEELDEAQKSQAERIVVKGELGRKLHTAFKGLKSLSSSSLNALALCLSGAALFAPFTGGVSLGAAGTVMGTVGAALTASAIAAISAIGLALVIAVFKGYDEVKLGGGGVELVIKKKAK